MPLTYGINRILQANFTHIQFQHRLRFGMHIILWLGIHLVEVKLWNDPVKAYVFMYEDVGGEAAAIQAFFPK